MSGQSGSHTASQMAGPTAQVMFASEDMSLFVDFGEEDPVERRALRVAGMLQGEGWRGRIDVALEPARGQGIARRPAPGWLDLSDRGWLAAVTAPAALFDRLEQAFLSPRRYRFVLSLTAGPGPGPDGRWPLRHVSVLFNPEG